MTSWQRGSIRGNRISHNPVALGGKVKKVIQYSFPNTVPCPSDKRNIPGNLIIGNLPASPSSGYVPIDFVLVLLVALHLLVSVEASGFSEPVNVPDKRITTDHIDSLISRKFSRTI